jgi:hypothetical protein
MPVLAQWILAGLGWALASGVGRIMTTLGLTFVMVEFVAQDWLTVIAGLWGGVPGFILGMAGFYRIDDVITIIVSAVAVKVGTGLIKGVRKNAAGAQVGL